jgi:small subunit ribosomal protein S7
VPDARYSNRVVTKFINKIMQRGKKSLAERIMYGALERLAERTGRDPIEVFDVAMRNATPVLEVKPRRVGGATYQVPVEIKGDRRVSLAIRWLLMSARARSGKSMQEKLAAELLDAANNVGATIKRREDTHRMAEANRAFAHYRW